MQYGNTDPGRYSSLPSWWPRRASVWPCPVRIKFSRLQLYIISWRIEHIKTSTELFRRIVRAFSSLNYHHLLFFFHVLSSQLKFGGWLWILLPLATPTELLPHSIPARHSSNTFYGLLSILFYPPLILKQQRTVCLSAVSALLLTTSLKYWKASKLCNIHHHQLPFPIPSLPGLTHWFDAPSKWLQVLRQHLISNLLILFLLPSRLR